MPQLAPAPARVTTFTSYYRHLPARRQIQRQTAAFGRFFTPEPMTNYIQHIKDLRGMANGLSTEQKHDLVIFA